MGSKKKFNPFLMCCPNRPAMLSSRVRPCSCVFSKARHPGGDEVSHPKPWLFRVKKRDDILPSYMGIFINHYCIRIPIKEPV